MPLIRCTVYVCYVGDCVPVVGASRPSGSPWPPTVIGCASVVSGRGNDQASRRQPGQGRCDDLARRRRCALRLGWPCGRAVAGQPRQRCGQRLHDPVAGVRRRVHGGRVRNVRGSGRRGSGDVPASGQRRAERGWWRALNPMACVGRQTSRPIPTELTLGVLPATVTGSAQRGGLVLSRMVSRAASGGLQIRRESGFVLLG